MTSARVDDETALSTDEQSVKMDPSLLPANSSPELSVGSHRSSSHGSEKLSKKLLGEREKTLRLVRISPLSLIGNNKVGSSVPSHFGHPDQLQQRPRRTLAGLGPSDDQILQNGRFNLTLPVTSRKVRDSGSLLFMFAFLGFLAYIVWDGVLVKESDIDLILHGHDSYGNICGRNNRPISMVERSGRNFTQKPYTKYTLINAQFERYTLDSDRLRQGELFYVKEEEVYSRLKAEPPPIAPNRAVKLRVTRSLSQAPEQGAVELIGRRAFEQPEVEHSSRKNQTFLNSLKTTLMYRYPPMYDYSQRPEPLKGMQRQGGIAVRQIEAGIESVAASSAPADSQRRQHDQRPPAPSVSVEAIEARASNPLASGAIAPRPGAQAGSAGATTTTERVGTVAVVFDDSERNDHVLVSPYPSARPRQPGHGFTQNEASSQLLYLTECVDHCPADHIELIFHRCMPKNWRFSLFPNAINVTRTFIDDLITDLTQCHRELIYIFSFALALSLALLILLRFLASVIIWSCLTLLISLFISMASYSWLNYYNQIVDLNNAMPHDSMYAEKLSLSDKWLIGAIFLTFVAFAVVAMVIFMRKRILLVTMLFRESGKAIADMPMLLLQPLLTFGALLAISIVFGVGLVCLQSIKQPVIDMHTGFVVFKAETLYKIMKWYHIFAFLWVSHFAIACQHYVIGASVSKWYFSPNRYQLNSPIGSSVSELILYYLGSVALGSFLVAVFKVIRIITRQIQFLVQRNCMSPGASSPSPNGPQAALGSSTMPWNSMQTNASCCGSFSYVWRLFIWFFDHIVMIINRDAYVEVAIHGSSFLTGAQQAFTVLASNPLKLLAIKSVSNALLAVAKICVVFGTVSMAIVLVEEKASQLNYSWSPIVISAVYAYIVAHWFLSVYEMVMDALFICYCEDYERSKKQEATLQINNFMTQLLNSGDASLTHGQ